MTSRSKNDAAALWALELLDAGAPASTVLDAFSSAHIPAPLSVEVHPRSKLQAQLQNASVSAARSIEASKVEGTESLARPLSTDQSFRHYMALKFQVLEGSQVC